MADVGLVRAYSETQGPELAKMTPEELRELVRGPDAELKQLVRRYRAALESAFAQFRAEDVDFFVVADGLCAHFDGARKWCTLDAPETVGADVEARVRQAAGAGAGVAGNS